MRSAKTNRIVVLPLHRVLRTHLEPLRGSDGEPVFAVPPERWPLIREELGWIGTAAGLSGVTLNQIRRLSGTAYETAQHGSLEYPEAFDAIM